MKIKLFLDEDVHSGLAHALRKRGYDAIHAHPPQPACKKPTRTLGNHCFKTTPIQRNDVKIITPASA